jgi:hypothetical protein
MRLAMQTTANPFRLIYRSFDRTVFDRIKSDNMFALRGFDLSCIGHVFPGYVLERPATLHPGEPRLEVLSEAGGVVFLLVYTRLGRACRILTGWVADPAEAALWFDPSAACSPPLPAATILRGRIDPARLGVRHDHDLEPRPVILQRDRDATMSELTLLRRRMTASLRAAGSHDDGAGLP